MTGLINRIDGSSRTTVTALIVLSSVVVARMTVVLVPGARSTIVVLGLVCLLVDGRRGFEKSMSIVVGYLGIAPLLSWMEGAARIVDPATCAAGLSVGLAIASMINRPTLELNGILSAVPAVITYGWWRNVFIGPSVRSLQRLLVGWDHFGHFDLFASARENGVFRYIVARPHSGSALFNERYPAGIHSAWAFLWRPGSTAGLDRTVLLHDYTVVVVVNLVLVAFLITYSLLRIIDARRSLLPTFLVTSVFTVAMVAFGHLSMSLWGGFPNFGIAIAASVLLVSVCRKPLTNRIAQEATFAGAVLMVAYNWHPLLLGVGGIVGLRTLVVIKQQRGGAVTIAGYAVLAAAAVAPIILTMNYGVDHLTLDGGLPSPSPNIAVAVLCFSIVARTFLWRARGSESVVSMLVSPSVLGSLAAGGMTLVIRLSSGGYPYYQKKIVFGLCIIVLCDVAVEVIRIFDRSLSTFPSRPGAFILSAQFVLATVAVTQIFGFLGPDWLTYAPTSSAPGLSMHKAIDHDIDRLARPARVLLSLKKVAGAMSPGVHGCLVLADLQHQDYDPILTNYWLGSMLDVVSETHIERAQKLAAWLTGTVDPHENAWAINNILDVRTDCPVVGAGERRYLSAIDVRWSTRILLLESDGSVTVPKEFEP